MEEKFLDFSGRCVLITGAASGMGETASRSFARYGAAVVLTDINLGRAQVIAQEVVDLVMYLASDKAAFITGDTYLIDGGRACLYS